MKGTMTRGKIIRAGIDLFSRYGYDAVTMRQIADQVGIRGGSIYNHFSSKDELLEAVIDRLDEFMQHYSMTADEVVELLHVQTPEQILTRFVTAYQDEDDTLRMTFYRLMYMGMYSNGRLLQTTYRSQVQGPVQSLTLVLEVLAEAGAIPPCDSRAIAELWTRTSLVYGYRAAHDYGSVKWEEYVEMTRFFIEMAVRGVQKIPVESIDLQWEPRYNFPDIEQAEDSTRKTILLKALDLFSNYGFANVSMRQIAQEAGIQAGSIYNHFSGKGEIIETITRGLLTSYKQYEMDNPSFRAVLQSGDPSKIVLHLCSSYPPMEQKLTYKVYRVLFREQYLDDNLQKIFMGSIDKERQTMASTLDHLVELGRIAPCESRKIATAYVHTICSLTVGATVDEPVPEEHLRPMTIAPLVSLVLYGYVREKGA